MKNNTINILKYTKEIINFVYEDFGKLAAGHEKEESRPVASWHQAPQITRKAIKVNAKTWFKNGKWHREGGPAIVSNIRDRFDFCENGKTLSVVQSGMKWLIEDEFAVPE